MTEPSFYNQAEFVDSLWNEIKTNGLYDSSKIDFYDFVLYLLIKYDTNHFLDENDNADNERLLKVNSTKIKAAKKNKIDVVLSSHDFDKTPSVDEMLERYKGMYERKADIIKLAVMPHSEQDVNNLLEAVSTTYDKYSDVKVVGISMGELGRRTRIEGYKYGSYLTFAIIDKASAPGQVSVDEL